MLHQTPKKKKSKRPSKKYLRSTSSKYDPYQAENPLTKYVERVIGINCTEKN